MGWSELTDLLNLTGYRINIKGKTVVQAHGLQTAYNRKPRRTIRDPASYKYPYLLRELKIERPDQLWADDII